MEYCTLCDLINQLTYSTKLHIGVLFFGNRSHPLLTLPQRNRIHPSPICDVCKRTPEGMQRCFRCRNAAIQQALRRKKPFGAQCINGIYEYTRPVLENGQVLCILYIGNILPPAADAARIQKTTQQDPALLQTLEPNISQSQCESIGNILESYIRMVLLLQPSTEHPQQPDPLIENVKAFLDANLEYDISVRQLAELFHYSSKYLGRLFKQQCGQTVAEYVNTQRLKWACRLLSQSSQSVIEISFRVGFNQVPYFNRLFAQHYGTTPTQYRRTRRGGS